jgi:hypothetical protein
VQLYTLSDVTFETSISADTLSKSTSLSSWLNNQNLCSELMKYVVKMTIGCATFFSASTVFLNAFAKTSEEGIYKICHFFICQVLLN